MAALEKTMRIATFMHDASAAVCAYAGRHRGSVPTRHAAERRDLVGRRVLHASIWRRSHRMVWLNICLNFENRPISVHGVATISGKECEPYCQRVALRSHLSSNGCTATTQFVPHRLRSDLFSLKKRQKTYSEIFIHVRDKPRQRKTKGRTNEHDT